MRIPKNFGERTQVELNTAKKYYLIYEGEKTEAQYFSGIELYKEKLGIDGLIEIVPILRSYNEEDWSNPKKILDKLIEYVGEENTDFLSIGAFIDKIIDWLLEEQIIGEKGIYNKSNMKNVLVKLFENETEIVPVKEASDKVSQFLTEELNISNSVVQIEDYINRQFVTYESGYDKICLIADRDKQSFKDTQYDYVVATCKEKGYNFYVSNPCFEFWLLLHYDEVMEQDRNILLLNPKENRKSKKRFIEKLLSELMGGYNKNNLNFDKLADRVGNAMENEKAFCEDVDKLKTALGSNVGLLIKEMK